MQPEQYQQLTQLFIEESQENLHIIESGILNLSEIIQNNQKIQELFLAAHSIKGGAAFLGLKSIQKLALGIEKCFRVLKEHPIQADHKLISLLFRGFEFLQILFQTLSTTEGLTEEKATEVLHKSSSIFEELHLYLDILVIEAEPEPAPPPEDQENLEKLMEEAAEIPHQSHLFLPSDTSIGLDPKIQVSAKLLDHLSNLVAELLIKSNKISEENIKQEKFLKTFHKGLKSLKDQENTTQEFNSIWEELNYTIKNWVSSFQEIQQLNFHIIEIKSQLNKELNQVRMIQFFQMTERWHKTLLDSAAKLNKSIEFVVEGGEILVDRFVIERLYEPINLLLQNALGYPLDYGISWGIETSDIRQSLGKPSVGQIGIGAFYQGNRLVITISDDGTGIDPEEIKKVAIQRKVLPPDRLQSLSLQNVYDLLFSPHFIVSLGNSQSFSKNISLNVLHQVVHELRGSIQVDSSLGKGTKFTLQIPRVLNIASILCCSYQDKLIAFLSDEVVEILTIPAPLVQSNYQNQNYITWRDLQLSIDSLEELFEKHDLFQSHQPQSLLNENLIVVILSHKNDYLAIQVNQVLHRQEVAIKQPNDPMYQSSGIAGITLTKDAQIIPILAADELIELSNQLKKD